MAHDSDDGHECGKCGQTFDTEAKLEIHAEEAHGIEL